MRGKVCRSIPKRIKEWDHPRICGEKLLQVVRLYAAVGSPPHMRGKVLPNAVQLKKSGITPAYAGKSTAAFSSSRTTLGSPPHMQGKEVCENGEVEIQRITPAYAGKSGISSQAKPSRRDHPRICGEKCFRVPYLPRRLGSPPHMRGKVQSVCDDLARVGITPAYAGKR